MSVNEVHHRVRFGPYEADLQTSELWKHGIRIKLSPPISPFWLASSPDGKMVWMEQEGQEQGAIMMINNFH